MILLKKERTFQNSQWLHANTEMERFLLAIRVTMMNIEALILF
jgi:hypothetical protein